MDKSSDKKLVIVTGFSPFGEHAINPSWEAVKILPDKLEDVDLAKHLLPVVYDDVDRLIPDLWKKQPMMIIHVGVSKYAREFTLETTGHPKDYNRLDCNGRIPIEGVHKCAVDLNDKITCRLNVDEICKSFNGKFDDMSACVSNNAGRYLCEYTYYSSLAVDPGRALFVHVPDVNKPYSIEQTSRGLYALIELCVNQIRDCNVC